MKLTWASVFIIGIASASAATLGDSALKARSIASIKERCASGDIISTSTLQAGGQEVKVTTRSCATSSKATTPLAARAKRPLKRQDSVCTSDCTILCDTATGNAPFASDCQTIINALEAQFPNSFTVPPMTFSEAESGTCGFKFFNFQDDETEEACYIDAGLDLGLVSAQCFPGFDSPQASSDGFCVPDDETWAVEGFLVPGF
ncbi:hypothetical protein K439DRAFT_166193 [Ramaria rubella]|nr:hypothetical protein K439DRAFT_166193 [Ramaria rubella]